MAIGLILLPRLDGPASAPRRGDERHNHRVQIAQRLGGSGGTAALGSVYAATGFHDAICVLAGLAALSLTMIASLPAGPCLVG